MRAGAVFGERHGMGSVDEAADIELDPEGSPGFPADFERDGQFHGGAEGLSCEVKGKPGRGGGGIWLAPETSFECEEYVASLPAPVQTIQRWIQRVGGRPECRIAIVQCRRQAHGKTQGPPSALGGGVDLPARALVGEAEPGRIASDVMPGSISPRNDGSLSR